MVSIFDEGHKWLSRLRKRVFTAMLCGQTGESPPQKARQEPPEDHLIGVNDDGAEDEFEPPMSSWVVDDVDDGPEDEPGPNESSWIISIKEKLKQAGQDNKARPWQKLSSCQIPHYLKDGKDNTYFPQVVSLGPYYHDKMQLRQINGHKWRCLHRMLRRTNNYEIVPYLDSVKKVEEKARACYEGKINMSSDEFTEMMVLDGCFVIELFWGFSVGFEELGYHPNDPIFSFMGLAHIIRRDMIMLENQIPFFILQRLFFILCDQPDKKGLLAKLAHQFFYPLTPTKKMLYSISMGRLEFDPLSKEDSFSCLELFWRSLLHPGLKQEPRQELELEQESEQEQEPESEPELKSEQEWMRELMPKWRQERKREVRREQCREQRRMRELQQKPKHQQHIPCVTKLRKGGIKFRKGEMNTLWEIQFEGGTLTIPQLLIHDGTRLLFLNLIAFEQCHINSGNFITSYVIFMVNLINSPEDVGHLYDCGIIEHRLGSDVEVADLFNRLSKEVNFDIYDSYLYKVTGEVNTYSNRSWHRWIAGLKLEYFNNPWSIISLIAAFILLALTFTQTFYGAYGYYKPRS